MALQLGLIAAQMYLGIITRPRPQKFTFQDLLDSNKGDETRPIPYIRGKWKTKPQRIWLGDFSARAVERDSHWSDYLLFGVVGAALLDFITVSYRYYVGQGFALTWGPINRVRQVFVDDLGCAVIPVVDNAGGSLLIDHQEAFGGDQPPGEGGIYALCDVIAGNYTQGRNTYLQSIEGNIPALHGVACLIIRGRSGFTESGYFSAGVLNLREWQVEVMATPDVLATGDAKLADDSYNRIHSMYEWATSADYGAEYPPSRIHLPSWRAAAATVFSEGLGFSGEINTGGSVGDVFNELKASVDAEVYEHPRDGLKIKLVRKDYSIPSIPVLDYSNTNNIEEYTPGDYADTFNRVTLDYINAENNYQPRPAVYEDPANRTLQQRMSSKSIQYPGVASAELAQKLVTRDGRALAQPFPPLIANAGEIGRQLWPGDVYKFEWISPLVQKVFRVHSRTPGLSYDGEKNFKIESTEDQYSIGLSVFGAPTGTSATNPADIWATAPPSAAWDDAEIPPAGLEMSITTGLAGTTETFIRGAIEFGVYAGGQYARVYVTPPGGVETLTPIRLSPDVDNKATFTWPALIAGTYEFCVQTYSLTGTTNGTKVCETIAASSPSVSPSSSTSPSVSPSVSPSSSTSPSSSASPSISPSSSGSGSESPSISASQSPSSSQSPSGSISPSASTSPSSSVSPSVPPFLPSDLADIWEWWEPSRGGFADNDDIATLAGEVAPGAGHDFTAGATVEPVYKENILNGLGVARFNGTTEFMDAVDPSALTAAHLFMVIKVVTEDTGGGVWQFGTSGSTNHYAFTDGNVYDGSCSTTRRTVGDPAPTVLTNWVVVEVVSISGEWTYKLDGTQKFTTGTNTVGINTSCKIGVSHTLEKACDIAGVYLFSAKLGAPDRTSMVDYLNDRFGLSIV